MERDCFIFKTQISFGIKTDEIEPEIITKDLGIKPDRFFKKGDEFSSKFSSRIGHREWNVWMIDSNWTILKEETVSHHIEYLKKILLPKVDILKKYKNDSCFELSFWVTIQTDDVGFSFDLLEDEMAFLNDFSNRVHFALIVVPSLDYNEAIS